MVQNEVLPAFPPRQVADAVSKFQAVSPIPVSSIAALKVAINRRVKNRILPGDSVGWNSAGWTFRNREIAPEDFIAEVSSGFAFCPWMGGKRHTKNFRCMQVLAVDVDSGLTIDEVLAHEFFQKFGWFIYTTVSHDPGAHRFRAVFLLAQPIGTAEDMKRAHSGIRLLLGGGLRCDGAARMFYGSENCEIYRVGHVLPAEQLEYVIELGKTATACRAYIQMLWQDLNDLRGSDAYDRRSIKRLLLDACYSYGE